MFWATQPNELLLFVIREDGTITKRESGPHKEQRAEVKVDAPSLAELSLLFDAAEAELQNVKRLPNVVEGSHITLFRDGLQKPSAELRNYAARFYHLEETMRLLAALKAYFNRDDE